VNVLFCSFDSPGHLFPLAGLALELRARGHAVAFVTGLPAVETLGAAGLERIPRSPTADRDSFRVNTHHHPLAIAIDVAHVEHAIGRFHPDVLVTHQLCHAPLLVRERRGIPVAVMGFFSFLWHWPPYAAAAPSPLEPMRRWRVESDTRIVNQAREHFRLPPFPVDAPELPFLGDLFMLRSVPELLPGLAALPPQVHPVGACQWEPPAPEGAWEALRARFARPDAPLVYVQHGRTFGGPGFWAELAEALDGQPVQVVASVGRMDQEVGRVPENFAVLDHVPQGVAMPHARAVVSGGHSTVVLGALSHGLPGVVIPTGGETPDNAETLVEAGCAVRLGTAELAPGPFRAAVDDALGDAALARACRGVQRALARSRPFDRAAALVERLAAGGARVERAPEPEAAFAAASAGG